MKPCAGVLIEDMGWKMGLNGIDNARLRFTKVRVPRVNIAQQAQ
jgi:acyl-CoA oxidase